MIIQVVDGGGMELGGSRAGAKRSESRLRLKVVTAGVADRWLLKAGE